MNPATIPSIDQLGHVIQVPYPPLRIVSLVPSQTEFLFDINLDETIAGITRFCVHPVQKVKTKPHIGGTKQFDIEKIKALQPDLIIGNKEENYVAGIEELRKHFPVWMSDIYTLDDACRMMHELGRITQREKEAAKVIDEVRRNFAAHLPLPFTVPALPAVAYFIWRKPYMVAAGNTFINHLLGACGFGNIFGNLQRYPEILPETLTTLKPDYIFLSSEPYSFSEKHFDEFKQFSPSSKIILVDGEMFSWYGSRLRYAVDYFRGII